MTRDDGFAVRGDLTIFGACEHPENAHITVDDKGSFDVFEGAAAISEAPPWMREAVARHGHLFVLHEPNGFVSAGLDMVINRAFAVGGPPAAIQSLIVAKSTVAVASTDTSILGGSTVPTFTTAAQNALSKALTAPAPAAAVNNAVTGGMSFVNADVTGGANFWPINRVGLLNVAPATAGGLVDVIGNTAAQADPYSRTFSVDFSAAGVFTLSPSLTITAVRRQADMPVL